MSENITDENNQLDPLSNKTNKRSSRLRKQTSEPNYVEQAASDIEDDMLITKTVKRRTSRKLANTKAAPDSEDADPEQPEQGKHNKVIKHSDFDRAMQLVKQRKQSKNANSKNSQDVQHNNIEYARQLIHEMLEMARLDLQAYENRQLSINKLKFLPTAIAVIKRRDLQEILLEEGLLDAIKEWLMPMSDKTLPNPLIREELLRLLNVLPITFDDYRETLKSSGLGKVLMILKSHSKETMANKKLANSLITKLARNIYELGAESSTDIARVVMEDKINDHKAHIADITVLKRIPKASTTLYTKRPIPQVANHSYQFKNE